MLRPPWAEKFGWVSHPKMSGKNREIFVIEILRFFDRFGLNMIIIHQKGPQRTLKSILKILYDVSKFLAKKTKAL